MKQMHCHCGISVFWEKESQHQATNTRLAQLAQQGALPFQMDLRKPAVAKRRLLRFMDFYGIQR